MFHSAAQHYHSVPGVCVCLFVCVSMFTHTHSACFLLRPDSHTSLPVDSGSRRIRGERCRVPTQERCTDPGQEMSCAPPIPPEEPSSSITQERVFFLSFCLFPLRPCLFPSSLPLSSPLSVSVVICEPLILLSLSFLPSFLPSFPSLLSALQQSLEMFFISEDESRQKHL